MHRLASARLASILTSRTAVTAAIAAAAAAAATSLIHELLRRRAQRRLPLAPRVSALLHWYLDPRRLAHAPVVRLRTPDQLEAAFSTAGCPLTLTPGAEALTDDELLRACGLVLRYSVCSSSPTFFNQLYARPDPASAAADWLATALNANVHTFEVAPVLTLIERHLLTRIATAIGGDFVHTHDGLFVPGGAIANIYAMHLARHRVAPQVHTEGASGGPRLVGFVSRHSHYSYLKSARLLGIGSNNLIEVDTDPKGSMRPTSLAQAIAEAVAAGHTPFFVGCTAGTTVVGGFDPVRAVKEVCREHELWLHVDAAWGGAALFSPTHRSDLDGVEEADSVSWSAHKMLGAALQCAVFITKHAHALTQANACNAAYLFQPDKLHANLDPGDKTIQCGRKPDMLKLWLLFKSLGDDGVAQRVDHAYELAAHAASRIRASEGAFELAHEPSCTNVCFWYVPRAMRPLRDTHGLTKEHPLHLVAPAVKAALQREGTAMIGFQSVGGKPNFFRWVFASAIGVTHKHVDALLARIEHLGG